MAESWQLIDGHRSSDGLTYTAVYWCSNTGAIKTETTSDGRFRAGDGPRIKRPTQAKELDQLRQRVGELEAVSNNLRAERGREWERAEQAEAKLALAEQLLREVVADRCEAIHSLGSDLTFRIDAAIASQENSSC